MNDRSNRYCFTIKAVDNPVAVCEDFPNIFLGKLRHNTAGAGKIFKIARRVDYLPDNCTSIGNGVARYIPGDRLDVFKSVG